MENKKIIRVKSITEGHRMRGLPPPQHPLISIVDCGDLTGPVDATVIIDFYAISIKRNCDNLFYGQQQYDFDEGVMGFMAPNQILSGRGAPDSKPVGWMLFVHPDFFWNTPLAKKIKQYEFFHYAVNEALFLSSKEEELINGIIQNIIHEYHSNIDRFSQDIIISHLETLLNYSERFYQRQFITRKRSNHQLLTRLEKILAEHFDSPDLAVKGLPTVQSVSDALNVSASYLSSLLKTLTGHTTQQHIHTKLIDKAKERLSTTNLTVSEIAYELGFEHPQSFSKLFKTKTQITPLEFRQAFI
jgi:AraC family transcriptional regulator, transcriptional activator of pobA